MYNNSTKNLKRQGFSLTELLVVTAVMAILAGLLLPVISKAKGQVRRAHCISNQRQLLLTWNLYNGDNNDLVVANGHGPLDSAISLASAQNPPPKKFWVPGDDHFYYPAFTNAQLLADSQSALFGSYLSSAAIYKCPEDNDTIKVPGVGKLPHVRSYSMNAYVGWSLNPTELNPNYRIFNKTTSITGQSPSDIFVFQDVHPDSICFPAFIVRMPGEPESFYHYPSSLHSGRGVVTFADGHAETHRWTDSRTTLPVTGGILAHWNDSPGNADLAWIRDHTSYSIGQ